MSDSSVLVQTPAKRTVRVERKIPKVVLERRQWAKFGDAKDAPPGPEQGITTIDDERLLILSDLDFEKEKEKESEKVATPMGKYVPPRREELAAQRQTSIQETPGKYVPPSFRNGSQQEPEQREEKYTIVINNIPEDTNDNELRNLCQEKNLYFSRLSVVKAKQPPYHALKCYVDFRRLEDAKKAVDLLKSTRLEHMILSVELVDKK